ncbi:MAG: oxidoreductase [Acidimicrobiales bacterium mtb01]|nr:oxidoreductase [Actinomycetota bacterium]TEX45395.1 MAG: oxidoreductase [Acidimicrobiales bacterium mtb01]
MSDTVSTQHTFCRVCHASCPLEVDVQFGRVTAVRGVPEDPIFAGYTCIKGRQLPDQMVHDSRLRSALRRRPDGTFEPVSSGDALDAIASELRRIIDTYGPRAVASYTGTGGYQNSLAVPAARAFHQGIGSSSFYTSVTIDQPAKGTAPFRTGIWEAGYHNFTGADVLLAVGYNPMVSSFGPTGGLQGTNPFVVIRDAKKRGLKLIVIDPRRTELATQADIHLAVKPGEDPTLLAGITKIILDEDLIDHEFCDRWVGDLDQLAASVRDFDLEYVARRCDVPAHDIMAAAHMFANGTRGTAGCGTGPNMAPHSSLAEHFVIVLNTICGRVNREGDEVESGFFLYPDMPRRAQVIAPRNPTPGPAARFRNLHGMRGEMPTTTLAEEILTPGEGQVRALIVSGGNPVVAWPDQELTIRAMKDLELLVVVDHRMSATAEFAHYVVAPTLSLERADVPHLMDRWFRAPYTNYTEAIVPRLGDVLNEWEVFYELTKRLGVPLPFPGGAAPTDHQPSDDEILELAYAGSRMSLADIKNNRMKVHPEKSLRVQGADPDCTARFTLAPSDIADELAVVRSESDAAEALGASSSEYPFRLVSRRLKHVLNSLGSELPGLAVKGTTNPAYMNPDDMADHGLSDGDIIEITSPRASLHAVVETAPDIRRGVISMAHSWGGSSLTDEKVRDIGSPTNRLVSVDQGYDRVTGMVVQSAIPVRIRIFESVK